MVLALQNIMGQRLYDRVHDAMQQKGVRGKLKGLAMSLELAVTIVVITLLVAGSAYAGMMLLKRGKVSATQTELDQLRTAVLVYTATSVEGKAPTSFDFLINGYTDQAGMFIKDKLPQRWQDKGIVDSWGQAYTITVDESGVNGTISSPGVPGDNSPISVNF